MADKKLLTPEEQRRQFAEQAWLTYFNRTLYEQGLLTDSQRNQITSMIATRKPSAKPQQRDMDYEK